MMAKVPPPRGKGEPPQAASTVGNLDKPESEELVSLNFRVTKEFRRDFKIFAAQNNKEMVKILYEAFASLKQSHAT
jgi:hypothetical protein